MAYSLTYSYESTSKSYSVTGYSDITTSDNVVIPDKYDDGVNGEHPVTSIGIGAFNSCSSLTSITIPDSVTSIGSYVFYGCNNLKSVTIGNGVTIIGDYAFAVCSGLTSITIPDSVTSIGIGAFNSCSSLTSITIPDSVTSIGYSAFAGCISLTSVTIGNSVTIIGYWAFYGCSSLKIIVLFPSKPPTLGSTDAIPTTTTIYVQQSSKEAYKKATNWTAFANKIESNNTYLSLIRFNKKNKEYIQEQTIDTELSAVSKNPVQNKVIVSALSKKADKTYVDDVVSVFTQEQVDSLF